MAFKICEGCLPETHVICKPTILQLKMKTKTKKEKLSAFTSEFYQTIKEDLILILHAC